MSENRARTGLSKPREIERELREAQWRESGAAVSSSVDRDNLTKTSIRLSMSDLFGVDLGPPPPEVELNEHARFLMMAAFAIEEDERDSGTLSLAFLKLKELGLVGLDGVERLKALTPERTLEHGSINVIKQQCASGHSIEDAIEMAAVKFKVPSSSFEGAVQSVKRIWLRAQHR